MQHLKRICIDGLDGSCLFEENEGRSAQSDFAQVALIAIFLNSTSARISAEVLQVALNPRKDNGQSCFSPTIPGSATSFTKSTIQPSYIDIAVWIHALASIFFKATGITSE